MLSLGVKKGGKGESQRSDHNNTVQFPIISQSGMKTNLKCNLGQVYTLHSSNQLRGSTLDQVKQLVHKHLIYVVYWTRSSPTLYKRLHGEAHTPTLTPSLKEVAICAIVSGVYMIKGKKATLMEFSIHGMPACTSQLYLLPMNSTQFIHNLIAQCYAKGSDFGFVYFLSMNHFCECLPYYLKGY